jgi:hypothetical protein
MCFKFREAQNKKIVDFFVTFQRILNQQILILHEKIIVKTVSFAQQLIIGDSDCYF